MAQEMSPIQIFGISKLPEVRVGDDLPHLLLEGAARASIQPQEGDILVVTSKVISKVEGRVVDIRGVTPSRFAQEIAPLIQKDPRVTELILGDSKRIVRMARGLLISETRHGFICANAGLDQSNIAENYAVLLPLDPDKSAKRIRQAIRREAGVDLAVVVSDTFGRPWREGQTDVAIGVAGLDPLLDYRGKRDRFGHELRVLFPHGFAQDVGVAEREAGEGLNDLHDLLLVDDDAVGLFQDGLEKGMVVHDRLGL